MSAAADRAQERRRKRSWRRVVAAYLLDRAEQYAEGSGCSVALEDAAINILAGEPERADRHGELEEALMKRVRRIERVERPRAVRRFDGLDD